MLGTRPDKAEGIAMSVPPEAIGMCPAILVPDPLGGDATTFERTVRGAAAAGFDTFSLWSFWPVRYGSERARDLLDSLGATAPAIEAAQQWVGGPDAALAEASPLVDLATTLGAEMITTCALDPVASWSAAITGFRALCDAAGERGLRVCIEFVPCTGVPDLATTWRVVDESGAANGGLLVDMMHWHRQPGGPDFKLLEQIPGERIHYVQVCDTVTADADPDLYMEEAMTGRRIPGDGEVDIERLLRTLEQIGAAPWFAYEAFNHELATEGIDAMASRLAACHIE